MTPYRSTYMPRPSPEDWRAEYFDALPELEALARCGSKEDSLKGARQCLHLLVLLIRAGCRLRRKPLDVTIMRASQLDAARLDLELTAVLNEQFLKAFSLLQPRLLNALKPELSLLLNLLIFRFSVWKGKPTPGSALMNLRFRSERHSAHKSADGRTVIGGRTGVEGPGPSFWQKSLLGIGYVLARYSWTRLEGIAASFRWVDSPSDSAAHFAWRALQWCETAYSLASLANLLAFLRHGKYRSLLERIAGVRLVYERIGLPRALSFEYLNRQLVWHELSELLLFVLPLINVSRIKRFVTNNLPTIQRTSATDNSTATAASDDAQQCRICQKAEIVVPFEALPCGHVFCYFCLRSHTLAEPGYQCPRCGETVKALRRYATALVD